MADVEPDAESTRRHVASVRRHLLIYFAVGGVGLALAAAWAVRFLPEEGLPGSYPVGAGGVVPLLPGRCAKFGDRCDHSPGKLGTCIQREGCSGAHCLFCQSQH